MALPYKYIFRAGEIFETYYQAVLKNDEAVIEEILTNKIITVIDDDDIRYVFYIVEKSTLPCRIAISDNSRERNRIKRTEYRLDSRNIYQLCKTLRTQNRRGIIVSG